MLSPQVDLQEEEDDLPTRYTRSVPMISGSVSTPRRVRELNSS